MIARASERGAALLAVLAMVVLLAGFATVGLERLKAAGDRISDAQARSEAQLLASAASATAASLAAPLKARLRLQPTLLDEPIILPSTAGTVSLRFAEGGNCFNLNALAAPPAVDSSKSRPQADARPQDFARLLTAVGVPLLEANTVAQATAARLAQTGQLWADASEWRLIPGVTDRHWQLAGPLLCALPTREQATINLNSLTAGDAPILVALGLGTDQARRSVSARPAGGWASSTDFIGQSSSSADGSGTLDDRLGTSSRWMALTIVATTPRARVTREILLDTIQQPAELVTSRWRSVEIGVAADIGVESPS
jgi:general secretion pathway protein K